jgi:hypothetical protein
MGFLLEKIILINGVNIIKGNSQLRNKYVLVTGASSGIGFQADFSHSEEIVRLWEGFIFAE